MRCPAALRLPFTALATFLLLFSVPVHAAVSHGFRVPDGFEVSLYAGDDLAHDIYSMTTDSKGRIVVASKEYVKILHDTDGDGKADKATLFVKASKTGAHGMYFDGPDLILNGDGGIRRWRDTDGDGVADGEPEFWLRTERDGEHSANGIVKGPDGWFYLICGNDAGISSEHAKLPGSPIKQVNAGALVRISPDGKTSEVLAHGFRNPYDLDFHPLGQVFTYDADGERDHHLPWYSGTRIFDIATGAHHGWVLKGWGHAWNRPPSWPDNTERLWEVGRGSPTGVFVYRHRAFPARYRDGLFTICWTYGRLYFFPLTRRGSTFDTKMEIFMETVGDTGFAPVDAVVGPDGDLFVAIGGRGTIGSVFRVKHRGGDTPVPLTRAGDLQSPSVGHINTQGGGSKPPAQPLREILSAPQPLASWSRAKWIPLAKELGKPAFEQAALNKKLPLLERIRAVEVQVELFDGLSPELARQLAASAEPELIARVAWALARSTDANSVAKLLSELTHRDDPRIARAAWDALQSVGADVRRLHSNPELNQSLLTSAPTPDWYRGLNSDDRRVRAATVLAARASTSAVPAVSNRRPDATNANAQPNATDGGYKPPALASALTPFSRTPLPRQLTERQRLGIMRIYGPERSDDPNWQSHYFNNAAFVAATSRDPVTRLDAVRLLQLGLGDVKLVQDKPDTYDGFVASKTEDIPTPLRQHVVERVAPAFPSGEADLDRELGRLLGMLSADAPGLLERVTAKLNQKRPVEDDIHYLMVAARIPGTRTPEVTFQTALAVASLHYKMRSDGKEPSTFWPVRVANMFGRLLERDATLGAALIAAPNFGTPEHALFGQRLEKSQQLAAARALLGAQEGRTTPSIPYTKLPHIITPSFLPAWSPELVSFLTVLPDSELFPALRNRWQQPGLQDAVVLALARSPQPNDYGRFVKALSSFQPPVVEAAARSLSKLDAADVAPWEIGAALTSLRRHCAAPREKAVRTALADLLAKWIGQSFVVTETGDLVKAYAPWFEWFAQAHAAAAKELLGGDEDTAAFLQRLPAIAWDSGDAKRGQRLYEERACHRCHSTSTRIGPDLTGVASRLSREDLFVAILDPSRDISPTYLPKLLTTKSGATYSGFMVYDAPTAKLMQTGPDTTVRVTGDEVTSVVDTRVSLMPSGLLNGLKDSEVADFYAFLKTLKK